MDAKNPNTMITPNTHRNTGQLFQPYLVSSAVYTVISTTGDRTRDHRLQCQNSTTDRPVHITHKQVKKRQTHTQCFKKYNLYWNDFQSKTCLYIHLNNWSYWRVRTTSPSKECPIYNAKHIWKVLRTECRTKIWNNLH